MTIARALLAVVAGLCWAQPTAGVQILQLKAEQDTPDDEDSETVGTTPGVVESTPDTPCDGCEFTVDLRCTGIRPSRSAPFHRIQDCLLPLYGLIDLAKNVSERDGKKVCAVTWLDLWEGLNLEPFLVNLTDVPWHSLVNEREECSKKLPLHAINRTKWLGANQEYLDNLGRDPQVYRTHPVDFARNLHTMQDDVARVVGEEALPSIIVLSRKTGTRRFRPVAMKELLGRLHSAGLPIRKYSGKESVVSTIKMFSAAKGVLGYHGAAWINTYFSSETICTVEVSTYYDMQSKKAWRTSMDVGIKTTNIIWYFYLLPLNLLLDANHVQHDAYNAREEKDHFIKDLEWIPLRDIDIEEMAGNLMRCVLDPYDYLEAHPKHATTYNTRGWQLEEGEQVTTSGVLTSAGRDDCSGCDVTVDLRCEGAKMTRGTYFGSVAHCLLPAYEMLQVAREAAANSSAQVCAIMHNDAHSLRPFLESVTGIRWHKFLDPDSDCIDSLKFHTMFWDPELLQRGVTRQIEQPAQDQDAGVIHMYPVDLAQNLNWLQKDTVNVAGKPSPHIIVLQNKVKLVFPTHTLDVLNEKFVKFMSQPVTVFSAQDSITDTVKLFTNAGSVVGFHSPLWVNTIFTYTPHCLVEISTYEDLEKKRPWRTNADVKKLNPVGDWHFLHLRLQSLLERNNVSTESFSAAPNKDRFILNLPAAAIPDEDAVDVASRIYLCWQNKERAYNYAIESWGWHGHA